MASRIGRSILSEKKYKLINSSIKKHQIKLKKTFPDYFQKLTSFPMIFPFIIFIPFCF